MKKLFVLVAIALVCLLAWLAAAPERAADRVPVGAGRAMGAAPRIATPAVTPAPPPSGEPLDTPPVGEPVVPPEVIAPIATATAPPEVAAADAPPVMRDPDAPRALIIPVSGAGHSAIHDMFNEVRGNRRHEAIDILAPRGTPVIAADDGVVKKLFTSVPGGLTVYQFDPEQRFCYYYAHLDHYAAGLHEGQALHRGEVLGYVGTTGNAPKDTPHLHFALIRLDPDRRWWKGTYVNPYPLLAAAR